MTSQLVERDEVMPGGSASAASVPSAPTSIISPAQLRAARALLDWSRTELAQACGLSQETIKNIEHGTFCPQDVSRDKILETFSAHGVEFISFRLINVVGVVLTNNKDGGQS